MDCKKSLAVALLCSMFCSIPLVGHLAHADCDPPVPAPAASCSDPDKANQVLKAYEKNWDRQQKMVKSYQSTETITAKMNPDRTHKDNNGDFIPDLNYMDPKHMDKDHNQSDVFSVVRNYSSTDSYGPDGKVVHPAGLWFSDYASQKFGTSATVDKKSMTLSAGISAMSISDKRYISDDEWQLLDRHYKGHLDGFTNGIFNTDQSFNDPAKFDHLKVTEANYVITCKGATQKDGKSVIQFDIEPRKFYKCDKPGKPPKVTADNGKLTGFIKGELDIDSSTGLLVGLSGSPSKNPSEVTGMKIVQTYSEDVAHLFSFPDKTLVQVTGTSHEDLTAVASIQYKIDPKSFQLDPATGSGNGDGTGLH